ncbi:unnamed protein product, partial [Didymodactylos carnosus]
VLRADGPILGRLQFDATTDDVADARFAGLAAQSLRAAGAERAGDTRAVDVAGVSDIGKGNAARSVEQPLVRRIAQPAADAGEPVHLRLEEGVVGQVRDAT